VATLVTPISKIAFPLPFSCDGVAVTGSMITTGSAFHKRRAMTWTAAPSEAALLPAMPGGAVAAMCAVVVARISLALAAAAAASCFASRAHARAERIALSPALRAAEAASAARRGLVTRDGRITACSRSTRPGRARSGSRSSRTESGAGASRCAPSTNTDSDPPPPGPTARTRRSRPEVVEAAQPGLTLSVLGPRLWLRLCCRCEAQLSSAGPLLPVGEEHPAGAGQSEGRALRTILVVRAVGVTRPSWYNTLLSSS
jgi:hypothetical protein